MNFSQHEKKTAQIQIKKTFRFIKGTKLFHMSHFMNIIVVSYKIGHQKMCNQYIKWKQIYYSRVRYTVKSIIIWTTQFLKKV